MKLGHISDLHVLEIRDVRPWDFVNKRLVGGTNLLVKRGRTHRTEVIDQALDRLVENGVDHIAITGDLTNLALPSEFAAARRVVDRIAGAPHAVSVVPGNHDYYTPGAEREYRFERTFAPYLQSDLPAYQQPSGYPFCHLRQDVAIIGLNSGIATLPMQATGKVRGDELRATAALLADPQVRRRFTVVMIHHHLMPVPYSGLEYLRRLVNAPQVLRVLREGNVDLAIHGHNHHWATIEVPHLGGPGTLRICEAGSTSTAHYSHPERGGKFNIYHIENGTLAKVETHLFEAHVDDFVHWREQVFVQKIEA